MNIFKEIKRISGHTQSPIKNLDCSEFEINNWELSEFVMDKLVSIVGIRPFPLQELILMSGAVCRINPNYIFDWGTHIGKSARIFYEVCRYYNLNAEIHSIDLPNDIKHVEHPGNTRGKLVKHLRKVNLHQGDGISVARHILKNESPLSKVLFFCDGDHEYKTVLRELRTISKMPYECYILVHDTFFQSSKSKYNVGPHRAINKFNEKSIYKTISINTGLPGMTLLFKEAT